VHWGSEALHRTAGHQIALLSLCLWTSGLSAQSPEQRRALDAYRDSLTMVTDSSRLAEEETRLLGEVRKNRRDAYLHLRLGQLALRQADLGGASHYDDAASEFKSSTALAPGWPYAWYGLGLAEYALGSRRGDRPEGRELLTRGAWARAREAFGRAAALEPAIAPRLEELARQALRSRHPDRAAVIRDALSRGLREAHGTARESRLLLALGRVQRAMGDSTAATTLLAHAQIGEDRGVGLVELGRTKLLGGDLSGASYYFEGLASDEPSAVAEARNDFLMIATDAELADFDLRRGYPRADMVRRFWISRDRVELRPEGSRLAEHLRRLTVARQEFVFTGPDGVERADDRGRVFIRHGEPDERASFSVPGVDPNESWSYRRGGTDMVLHFSARSPGDFRLIESVLDVPDIRTSTSFGTSAAAPEPGPSGEQLLRSRSALSPLYRQRPGGGSEQVADFLARERALGRRGIQLGTGTDSYSLRYPLELNAWGDYVVGGGTGSEPAVQVLFAIPGYAIEPATGTVGFVYPVRVRFVALDPTGSVVASVDTLVRIEPGNRIAANRSLVGRIAVPIRPGRLAVQAAIQYGDQAGSAFGVDSIVVPSPGAGVLALGDLLIGTRRGRLVLPLPDGSQISLSPGGVVHRSDDLDLAVEIFGLAPGSEAALTVLVAPMETGAGGNQMLGWRPFPDNRAQARIGRLPGSDAITRWRASLPLNRLKAGSWMMAVVVTDSSGREARREASLEVQVP
jgi:GWxTD domain-containing protein